MTKLEDGYLDKETSHFVIGCRTLLNAKLVREQQHATQVAFHVDVPVGGLAGDPTPFALFFPFICPRP